MSENEVVDSIAQPAYESLDERYKDALSKVLFPDELSEFVDVLGVQRRVRPLTIKWTKALHAAVSGTTNKITRAQGSSEVDVDYTDDLCVGLVRAVSVLCEAYGWDDIKQAIADDDILISDLQALMIAQRHVQGSSDFTFQSCSLLVGLMQLSEIGVSLLMSALSMPAILNNTGAPSTS